MRGEDDRRAAGIDLAQEIPHGAADLDIDARGRLVEDQKPRLVHQGTRDHQTALHAAREAARYRVALVPQLQLLEVLLGALPRQLALDAVEPRLVDDDGLRRLEHVEVDFLRHDADAGLGRLELALDVVAEDADATGCLVHQRGDDADERGLTGAVGTEQREEVALLDVEVDATQRLDTILVSLDETADRQRIHRARRLARGSARSLRGEAAMLGGELHSVFARNSSAGAEFARRS